MSMHGAITRHCARYGQSGPSFGWLARRHPDAAESAPSQVTCNRTYPFRPDLCGDEGGGFVRLCVTMLDAKQAPMAKLEAT